MTRILLIIIAVLVVVIGVGGFFYFQKNKTSSPVTQQNLNTVAPNTPTVISGTINLNGLVPAGASISVSSRKVGDTTWNVVASNLPPQDGASWSWNSALAGTAYELQGSVMVGGQPTVTSDPVTVVAPSTTASISLVGTTAPEAPAKASISGTFNLNGYFPSGSTITIGTRPVGGLLFSPSLTGLSMTDNGSWSWNGANAGAAYDVQAYVQQGAATIASSAIQTITAPASNEVVTLNSTLTPPAPTPVGLSGTIQFNGPLPSNSTVSLGVRKTGTTNFQNVFNNVSASNGQSWSWNGASSGGSYDVQAYLWVNGTPYSQSQILTISAPASNETLTINAQVPPNSPPGGSINVSCQGQSNNMYQVNISYNTQNNLTNPQQFHVTLGYSVGSSELWNATALPSNPTQTQNMMTGYVLAQNTVAYAQYQYSTCANCGTYSAWSPSVQVSCN